MNDPAAPVTRLRIPGWMLDVPRAGLPRPGERLGKRVIVMGGGVAGLVTAYELARAGHDPIVLEAQNRLGGRIKTLRDFAPGLYAEAGAMRIPRAHALTLAYCEHFGLQMAPFVMGNPKGLAHIGGVRTTMGEFEADPTVLPFDLRDDERGKTCDQLWAESTADIKALLDRKGDAAWDEIAADYDQYSLQEFLQAKGWSEGAIEMYGLLNFVEAEMNNAALEELRETLSGAFVDMQTIVGGMDKFPNAFYPPLADRIRFGSEIESFEQDDDGITVHYETGARRESVRGDYAVCALPFSVLRNVEGVETLSHEKQKAIRQLNYSASTKILFQVAERRWEEIDGIIGGGATVTDFSIRRMNYPPTDPSVRRGVLLASYTWGQDALRWDAMNEDDRIEEALEDVERIHPWIREVFECGASHAWYDDRWARGAYAMFAPGQLTELHPDIVKPEGRMHFAGEHASLHHAWIQGALESGIRCAQAIADEAC
jgi:monoamine oxidase